MERPCECGCKFEDHAQMEIDAFLGEATTLYCKNCDKHRMWCYSFRPMDNLKYLEYLYEHISD